MKVWQLRAYLNSLPIYLDDMEVVYESGIDPVDGLRIFSAVDFLEPCEIEGEEDCILVHNGYLDEDEEIYELAKMN